MTSAVLPRDGNGKRQYPTGVSSCIWIEATEATAAATTTSPRKRTFVSNAVVSLSTSLSDAHGDPLLRQKVVIDRRDIPENMKDLVHVSCTVQQ
jgi:hypothetical protein